jgi:DNA polymerase III delta subunit
MLYVFHGSNTHSAVTKASSLVNSLRAKKPDASYVRIESENWTPSVIEEHLGGQGLFSNKYIILLDRVTENAEAKELLSDSIAPMQESSNIFIIVEGKISAELKKIVDKNAEKVVECSLPASDSESNMPGANKRPAATKEDFNIFTLADAVGQKDPVKSWMLYRHAIDNGVEPENIIGTIFWQLKSMSVSVSGNSAGETGLSPFVYSKAKRAAANHSPSTLDELTKKFVTLYHDGHRGKIDMEMGVERVLLGLG